MKIINPYSSFAALHKTSLDYIIANLPGSPTFDQLNDQLVNSFYIPNPANPDPFNWTVETLKTVMPSAYNGYAATIDHRPPTIEGQPWSIVNRQWSTSCNYSYTTEQQLLIAKITEGLRTTPVLSIGQFLSNMEEAVVSAGLNFEQQTPLLLALAIGKADYEYWLAQIQVAAAWVSYLNAETSINYGNLPGWLSASMQGALITYSLVPFPPLPYANQLVSTVAATGLVSGKVIFNWI